MTKLLFMRLLNASAAAAAMPVQLAESGKWEGARVLTQVTLALEALSPFD